VPDAVRCVAVANPNRAVIEGPRRLAGACHDTPV